MKGLIILLMDNDNRIRIMANHKNLIQNKDRTPDELRKITRKGGIASGKSRRHKRIISDRIKLAFQIATTANLETLKEEIAELMPNRHLKDNKKELKIKIAQAKTMKECGIDVYNMIKIAGTSLDDDKRIKAINSLWDREEGKPLAKTENKEVKEFSDEVEYLD